MIIVDIICIYSAIKLILYYRSSKNVYYILKGEGWLDKLAIGLLTCFGWEFILLEYELKSTDSSTPFLDFQKDLVDIIERDISYIIEKQINNCNFFSQYEKGRVSTYITLLEKKNLYRTIEILHLLNLFEDQLEKPNLILLRWSKWGNLIKAKYKEKGYNINFYKIYFSLKIQAREKYVRDILVKESLKHRALLNLCSIFYKALSNLFYSLYFYILRHIQSDIPSEIGKFDICAIIPGYFGTRWFNDLHWKKIQEGKKYRTLAILYGRFDDSIYSEFGYLAEKWISLGKLNSPPQIYSIYNWLWPAYPKILGRTLINIVRNILLSNIPWDYKVKIIHLFMEVSRIEVLFKKTGVKIFWSSVEGDHFESIASTIAINHIGGVSLGSTWSVYAFPGLGTKRNTNDIFFVWGNRQAEIFFEGGSVFKSMIIAGYPGDYYLKDYLSEARVLKKKWKRESSGKRILCFYDNFLVKDGEHCFSNAADYVKNLLVWLIKEPETFLVIKSKRKETLDAYLPSSAELLKTLAEQKRLIYEFEIADLAPGLASELVIGLGFGTLPCLLGTYGKDVILLDDNRYNEKWPIIAENITFIKKPGDIIKCLDNWIGRVSEDTMEKVNIEINPRPNQLDSFVDGKSVERITGYISSLIRGLHEGLDSDEAISDANKLYRKKWGEDKVKI